MEGEPRRSRDHPREGNICHAATDGGRNDLWGPRSRPLARVETAAHLLTRGSPNWPKMPSSRLPPPSPTPLTKRHPPTWSMSFRSGFTVVANPPGVQCPLETKTTALFASLFRSNARCKPLSTRSGNVFRSEVINFFYFSVFRGDDLANVVGRITLGLIGCKTGVMMAAVAILAVSVGILISELSFVLEMLSS